MRWKFPDPNDTVEASERQAVLKRIDRWWREFPKKTADLDAFFHGRKRWDLPGWMNQYLGGIDEHLMWEFGPGPNGGHSLVITPESQGHLRPLIEVILERAPEIPGWSFTTYRPPVELDEAIQAVKAKGGDDISDARVQVQAGEGNRVDLRFTADRFTAVDDDADLRDVFYLTEGLAGEEMLDHWIGVITTVPDDGTPTLPLDQLKPAADTVMQQILAGLPDRPCLAWRGEAKWTGWQVRPRPADDYPGQYDLIVASSCYPEMWVAAHQGKAFSSRRFSRHGETFCFLKIEGSKRPQGGEAEYRGQLGDAVSEALIAGGLGCSVGGGSGIRYCYIDLAVLDVMKSAKVVREVLRKADVPSRSWILFYEGIWSREWIGIWDDSPEPPHLGEG